MLPTVSTNTVVGVAGDTSRPYKHLICRDGVVGAAGQTASTKGYEPPLKIDFVVVVFKQSNITLYYTIIE